MPTVIGTRVKCPECGATSEAIGDVSACAYCGTVSRVQKRTQVFQMPVPLPPPTANQPQRIAIQVRKGRRGVIAAMIAGACMIGIWIALFFGSLEHHRQLATRPVVPVDPPHNLQWMSRTPLMADVNNDGYLDAIAISHDVTTDLISIVAISGANGQRLWQTPSLGTFAAVYHKQLAMGGGVLLYGNHDTDAYVDAYSLADGTKLYTARLGEVVDSICTAASPSSVKIITKDTVESLLATDTGTVTPSKEKRGVCTPVPTSRGESWPSPDFTMKHSKAPPGMTNHHLVGHEAPWIISGVKQPGSEVPMLGAFSDRDKLLWTTVVPAGDPMGAAFSEAAPIDVDAELVAAVYGVNGRQPPRLAVFERATGVRRFDVALASTRGDVSAVVVAPHVILVMTNASMEAFDRATGAKSWANGEAR